MQKRKRFTKEFKLEAVRLLNKGDRPAAELARELGINRNQLYTWQDEVAGRGEAAFPGQGPPASGCLARYLEQRSIPTPAFLRQTRGRPQRCTTH